MGGGVKGIGVKFILGGAGDVNGEVMGNEARVEDGTDVWFLEFDIYL